MHRDVVFSIGSPVTVGFDRPVAAFTPPGASKAASDEEHATTQCVLVGHVAGVDPERLTLTLFNARWELEDLPEDFSLEALEQLREPTGWSHGGWLMHATVSLSKISWIAPGDRHPEATLPRELRRKTRRQGATGATSLGERQATAILWVQMMLRRMAVAFTRQQRRGGRSDGQAPMGVVRQETGDRSEPINSPHAPARGGDTSEASMPPSDAFVAHMLQRLVHETGGESTLVLVGQLLKSLHSSTALVLPPTVPPLDAAARQEHQQALIDAVRTYVMLLGRVEGQPVPAHLPEWAHIIKGPVEEYRQEILQNVSTCVKGCCTFASVEDLSPESYQWIGTTETESGQLDREFGTYVRVFYRVSTIPYLFCSILGFAFALASLVGPTSIFRLLLDGYHAYFQIPWAILCVLYSVFAFRATMVINMIDATRRFRMVLLLSACDVGISLLALLNIIPSAMWLYNPVNNDGETMRTLYLRYASSGLSLLASSNGTFYPSSPSPSSPRQVAPHPIICAHQNHYRCTGWDTSCVIVPPGYHNTTVGVVVPIRSGLGCAPNCSVPLTYPISMDTCRASARSDTRDVIGFFLAMPLTVMGVFLFRSALLLRQHRRLQRAQQDPPGVV